MADTITSPSTNPGLTILGNTALIAARAALAKAGQFSTDFSAEAGAVGSTLKIPVLSADAAAAFDESTNNYGTGKGSLIFADVTFTHYVTSYNFTDAQLAEVPQSLFSNCGKAGGIGCGIALMNHLTAAVKGGSLTGKALTVPAAGTLTKEDLAILSGGAITDPGRAVLALNKAYFAKALALFDAEVYGGTEAIRNGVLDAGAFGFKSIIQLEDAMPTSTIGLVIPESAVAVASRTVPVASSKAYDAVGTVTDDDTGFTFGLRQFCDAKVGRNSIAVEALVGAGVVQGAKIQKITVATT